MVFIDLLEVVGLAMSGLFSLPPGLHNQTLASLVVAILDGSLILIELLPNAIVVNYVSVLLVVSARYLLKNQGQFRLFALAVGILCKVVYYCYRFSCCFISLV